MIRRRRASVPWRRPMHRVALPSFGASRRRELATDGGFVIVPFIYVESRWARRQQCHGSTQPREAGTSVVAPLKVESRGRGAPASRGAARRPFRITAAAHRAERLSVRRSDRCAVQLVAQTSVPDGGARISFGWRRVRGDLRPTGQVGPRRRSGSGRPRRHDGADEN